MRQTAFSMESLPPELSAWAGGLYGSSPPREHELKPLQLVAPLFAPSSHDVQVSYDDLTAEQVDAVLRTTEALSDLGEGAGVVSLGGYAGTGKSTLIPILADLWGGAKHIAFACPTGKAMNVLARKLRAAEVEEVAMLGTIHSLLYHPIPDPATGRLNGWGRRPPPLTSTKGEKVRKVIVDEASMLGAKMLKDLLELRVQVLAVGDHGQLPPVSDESVISDPTVRLETIHRQAAGSPILKLAEYVRKHGHIPRFNSIPGVLETCYAEQVAKRSEEAYARLGLDYAVLVRRNKPRVNINKWWRLDGMPCPGDIVICLRNSPPIYNGMRGVVEYAIPYKQHWALAIVHFPDDGLRIAGLMNKHQFHAEKTLESSQQLEAVGYPAKTPLGMLFDFGYALTVHKSQGSAFEEVLLYPERLDVDSDEEYARWLYTALTRAKKLTIVRY